MNRRSSVSTAATSVAAFATLGTAGRNTEARLVYTSSDWKLSEFSQLAKSPARVKQAYDVKMIAEGGFLSNIKNSLNGLHFGFGIPEEQIKVFAAAWPSRSRYTASPSFHGYRRSFAVSCYAVAGVRRSDLRRLVSGNPTEYKVSMPEIESAIIVACKVTKPLQLSGYCAAGSGRPTVCTSN